MGASLIDGVVDRDTLFVGATPQKAFTADVRQRFKGGLRLLLVAR
jgi:hypothetical protein